MQIAGSKVLLTGATGGIGQAIARAVASRGAGLILTGRRTDVLEPLAAETGGRTLAVDLADAPELDRLVRETGEVDILIANAGLPASGPLDSFSVEEIDRALDVNLRAPMVLAHSLTPAMVAKGQGHVVVISSLAGKATTPGSLVYNATKFGLRGFAGGLRADLHGSGVGVSAVFPGFVSDAGMFADAEIKLPTGVGTSTPEQVADAVVEAIEKNQGEVDVAPAMMRLTSTFAGVAPELAARMARALGAGHTSRKLAAGQRDKR